VQSLARSVRRFRPAFPKDEIAIGFFSGLDFNRDGKLTRDEVPHETMWSDLGEFDDDHDGAVSQSEFVTCFFVKSRYSGSTELLKRREYKDARDVLDQILQRAPDHAEARNKRAWLCATCPETAYRSGELAVQDATRACALTEWKSWQYLDTLAAAHAEAGDFAAAVQRQKQAMSLAEAVHQPQMSQRLALYQQGQPYRQLELTEEVRGSLTTVVMTIAGPPLLSADEVARSRRMTGWSAAWSPDSRKLVRNLSHTDNEKSTLEIVDLESGDTTTLCQGGADPSWSRLPGGPIALVRGPEGQQRVPSNEELWLVDPDGQNLRKVAQGGFPSWTRDGELYFRLNADDRKIYLTTLRSEQAGEQTARVPCSNYPTVSPVEPLAAVPMSRQLMVIRLDTRQVVASVAFNSENAVAADWSPDGRYLVYGSFRLGIPGLWLVDVQARQQRLLAGIVAARPRWSPDGRFIAAEERTKNEIVILDVSALDLKDGLPTPPTEAGAAATPAGVTTPQPGSGRP
jgi:hypothetical protein